MQALEKLLYKESGLLGVSGISPDLQVLLSSDDLQAEQAITLFVRRCCEVIAALAASMQGIDALVFTGGIGAYIAVTSHMAMLPLLYGFAVITWVAGFDVLYALQDIEFDRKEKLYSIPSRFGLKKALAISSVLHFV